MLHRLQSGRLDGGREIKQRVTKTSEWVQFTCRGFSVAGTGSGFICQRIWFLADVLNSGSVWVLLGGPDLKTKSSPALVLTRGDGMRERRRRGKSLWNKTRTPSLGLWLQLNFILRHKTLIKTVNYCSNMWLSSSSPNKFSKTTGDALFTPSEPDW